MLYNIVRKTKQTNSVSNQKSAHRNTRSVFQIPPMSISTPSPLCHLAANRTDRSAVTAQTADVSIQKNGGILYKIQSANKKASRSCIVQIGTVTDICRIQSSRRADRTADAQSAGIPQESISQSGRKIPRQKCGIAAGKNRAFQPSRDASRIPGETASRKQKKNKGRESAENSGWNVQNRCRCKRRQIFMLEPPMRC